MSTPANHVHHPLLPADSERTTVGCRHGNAAICRKNSLVNVCAFVRADAMCLAPPNRWAAQYRKLQMVADCPPPTATDENASAEKPVEPVAEGTVR